MVSQITKRKGCNYFCINDSLHFKKLMDKEFDYIVTPTIFNAQVSYRETKGLKFKPERVFGSPGYEIPSSGLLFFADSLFPSLKEDKVLTKGGILVVKLNKEEGLSFQGNACSIKFEVSYDDRNGKTEKEEEWVDLINFTKTDEYFQNNCVRKAVLLVRYVNFIKNFLRDRKQNSPSMGEKSGIPIPSLDIHEKDDSVAMRPLNDEYKNIFKKFMTYFENEMKSIGDPLLNRELEKLIIIAEVST